MCTFFSVPPREIYITDIQEPIVEGESTVIECVVTRTFPAEDVYVKLTYQTGSSDDGDVKMEDNGDGDTQKLIYTDTIVLLKEDHNLRCCAEWKGNTTYACDSQVIEVQCKYSITDHTVCPNPTMV